MLNDAAAIQERMRDIYWRSKECYRESLRNCYLFRECKFQDHFILELIYKNISFQNNMY